MPGAQLLYLIAKKRSPEVAICVISGGETDFASIFQCKIISE